MIKPFITIRQVDPRGPHVRLMLGDGIIVPTADSGWGITARPRAKGLTEWGGHSPIQLDVPVMLDGWRRGESVEAAIATLYGMMRKTVGKRDEPPVVRITGDFPVPYKGLDWVISGISPGAEIRRERDGRRVRAAMQIGLLEYVPGDIITRRRSPSKHHRENNKGDNKTNKVTMYTLKQGDTLQKIASKFYHKASRWHDIAKANDIRDPDHPGKPGRRIKIPR